MVTAQPLKQLYSRLWKHISKKRRGQFGLLLVLMVLSSFAEIVSIGAVLPFLGVLTVPAKVFEHPAAQPLVKALEIVTPDGLLLPLTIAFGLAALVAGGMRLLLLWFSTRLSYMAGADLSSNIYRRTLYQPYSVHIARNSSEIISGISTKSGAVIGSLTTTINLIGAVVMLVAILIALISVDPVIALIAFVGFASIYATIIKITRVRLLRNGQQIASESTHLIKAIQEGLGGIRDILIDGSQAVYCHIYSSADMPLRRAQGSNTFISSSPRFGIEALGMLLISVLAYVLAKQADGIARAIPILGALALGAQRLLPVLQQAYASWSGIQAGRASLRDALNLLDQPLPHYADLTEMQPLPFQNHIRLINLSFRYAQETPLVLSNLNLSISKGSRVGFIGTTGSGKSTLLDIVMGLLHPVEGRLEVDDLPVTIANHRAWQSHIAHVPQAIYLADSSVEENIAFGVPRGQIDHERVKEAAKRAQIASVIEGWSNQYQTTVGERGIRLSGGQRQRIGIARALYKSADVIIFDEATSALDNATEQAVMQAIEDLEGDLTVLIIAHRLTTLKGCTKIVELDDGGIRRVGTYQEIVEQMN